MKLRHQLEYAPVWLLVHGIGVLPRPLARVVGILLGYKTYFLLPRLRRVGMRNLELAFPEKPKRERKRILRGVYVSLGRQLAEFCLLPRYTRENTKNLFSYDRSEERRVGKECRSRGSPDHEKKKKKNGKRRGSKVKEIY